MNDELVSLRAVVVSKSRDDHNLFQQAASSSPLPLEIVEADSAASARRFIAAGADLIFLDGAFVGEEIAKAVSVARSAHPPAFTVLLAGPEIAAGPFETDAVAMKPSQLEETRQLIERSIRVRLPSRVLVVDDSSTMRSIVRKILAGTRFPLEVAEADEGFAALNLVRSVEFDIAFIDYNMPGFSGLETLAEFKREKRRVSVVMMTSTQDDALANRARELGAAFLKKPFFPADIEAVLCRFYGLLALNPQRA
jgi:CheY-like chemotaxis protein